MKGLSPEPPDFIPRPVKLVTSSVHVQPRTPHSHARHFSPTLSLPELKTLPSRLGGDFHQILQASRLRAATREDVPNRFL